MVVTANACAFGLMSAFADAINQVMRRARQPDVSCTSVSRSRPSNPVRRAPL